MLTPHLAHRAFQSLTSPTAATSPARCALPTPTAAGYLYEPSFEQVRGMLKTLREQRPVPNRVVQFSGGEPTIYPRFHDVLRMATRDGLHPHPVRDQRH